MTDHAASIDGEPIPKTRVDAFLEAGGSTTPLRGAGGIDMRLRRVGATSPHKPAPAHEHIAAPPTAPLPAERAARAARQRRRWATQVVVIDELARRACTERRLKPPQEASPPFLLTVAERDVVDLGSIVAAALAHSPAARLLLAHLEAEQHVPEAAVRDYYTRNRDRFLTAQALRNGADPFHQEADILPYEQAREGITQDLRRAAGHRAFFDWLDQARTAVVYAPGHEHPGDPSHQDHEHRH
jgi:hypothetical protein